MSVSSNLRQNYERYIEIQNMSTDVGRGFFDNVIHKEHRGHQNLCSDHRTEGKSHFQVSKHLSELKSLLPTASIFL